MKKKMYRVFIDVKAEDAEQALGKIDDIVADTSMQGIFAVSDSFRVQEDPLSDEEETAVLELARLRLEDANFGEGKFSAYLGNELDLSDKELARLQRKIKAVTDR